MTTVNVECPLTEDLIVLMTYTAVFSILRYGACEQFNKKFIVC